MSGNQGRLELFVDIFGLKKQRALALPTVSPPELIDSILQEFRELEYLGRRGEAYRLMKVKDRTPLDNDAPLDRQVQSQEQLILLEHVLPLPANATRPSRPIYLREQPMGEVYKLHWCPAIIGRPDSSGGNDLLAANLAFHPMALRVSRKHARITEENGQFFIESLSQNPTSIKDRQGVQTRVGDQKHPLHNGDLISLDHSQIQLKVVIRE